MRFLSLLTFFISFLSIHSQPEMTEEQQDINRQAIEAILSMVSSSCKSEMEAAIESQTDVSQECKLEIQQAVRVLHGHSPNGEGQDEDSQQTSETPATPPPPPRSGIHPGYWIAAFVIALFGGAAAYVMHVSKLLEEHFPPKPAKKLSKKKLEKARMKGGQ